MSGSAFSAERMIQAEQPLAGGRPGVSDEHFLRLHERYLSLQGEGAHSGLPCYFIRLAGCDLRCHWCDTPQAWSQGAWISRHRILADLPESVDLIQITGGEPLLQREALIELCSELLARRPTPRVLLETGGHLPLAGLPSALHIIMDIKLPSSGEARRDFRGNLTVLKPTDEIKFVVADETDFHAALLWIEKEELDHRFEVLISPVWGGPALADVASWILRSGRKLRMQTQLHKWIWGPEASGV